MSAVALSRSRGTIVKCNGCGASSHTGQVAKRDHREYLRTTGWGRGINRGTKTQSSTKRHDLCPPGLKKDRALAKMRAAERTSQIAARDAARKAKAVARQPAAAP